MAAAEPVSGGVGVRDAATDSVVDASLESRQLVSSTGLVRFPLLIQRRFGVENLLRDRAGRLVGAESHLSRDRCDLAGESLGNPVGVLPPLAMRLVPLIGETFDPIAGLPLGPRPDLGEPSVSLPRRLVPFPFGALGRQLASDRGGPFGDDGPTFGGRVVSAGLFLDRSHQDQEGEKSEQPADRHARRHHKPRRVGAEEVGGDAPCDDEHHGPHRE